MRKILLALLFLAVTAPLQAQRITIDIPGLADKAREVVDVTLDAQMLKLASKFFSDPNDRVVRNIVSKLDGVYVRSYEFDKEGEYDRATADRIRTQLGSTWKKIVNVRGPKEDTEIYLDMHGSGEQAMGLVVISAEPKQLTVINIIGPIDLDQLSHLEGEFGIPKLSTKKDGDHE